MIWGNDYSTDLFVNLTILVLFFTGYFIRFFIKRHRDQHKKDPKCKESNDTTNSN